MENASNALLMAAAVLIGVLIISAGVYIFTEFSNTSSQISKQIYDNQIAQFNSQFIKYESYKDEHGTWKNTCTAHDIVTVCNLAKQNNREYYGNEVDTSKSEPYYINVKVNGTNYFETKNQTEYTDFIKDNSLLADNVTKVEFICKGVEINENTKRVKLIEFERIN